jgi:hypothetical protein
MKSQYKSKFLLLVCIGCWISISPAPVALADDSVPETCFYGVSKSAKRKAKIAIQNKKKEGPSTETRTGRVVSFKALVALEARCDYEGVIDLVGEATEDFAIAFKAIALWHIGRREEGRKLGRKVFISPSLPKELRQKLVDTIDFTQE